MRVWLDDVRPIPDGFDVWVKTAHEAIQLLDSQAVDFISFDHDLGDEENGSGYDVAKWIEEMSFKRRMTRIDWAVHSANPVGRKNIEGAMRGAEKWWAKAVDGDVW